MSSTARALLWINASFFGNLTPIWAPTDVRPVMLLTKLTDYSKILFKGVDSLDCWNGPVTNCPIGNAELLELPRADAPPGAPMGTDDCTV